MSAHDAHHASDPAPAPATSHDHAAHEPGRGSRHSWLMMLCCVPMLAIAALLVATGVVAPGFLLSALLCAAMMGAMMFLMPGMHAGHQHGPRRDH